MRSPGGAEGARNVVAPSQPRVWVFDLDGTLIDSLTGESIRPYAVPLLRTLRESGTTVVVWSAGGGDYARQRCDDHGVTHLVDEFYDKEVRDAEGRWVSSHIRADATYLTFVDDRPEETPTSGRLLAVRPYIGPNPHDRGLLPLLELAVSESTSSDRRQVQEL